MKHTIDDFKKRLHLCVYGETLRDRAEGYRDLKSAIVQLNSCIDKRIHGVLADLKDQHQFRCNYLDFTYYFNEMTKLPFETDEYFELATRCKDILGTLEYLLEQ